MWLANKIGVRPQQLWTWMHGLHEPADETKVAIADALGRTVEYFWPADDADELPVAA